MICIECFEFNGIKKFCVNNFEIILTSFNMGNEKQYVKQIVELTKEIPTLEEICSQQVEIVRSMKNEIPYFNDILRKFGNKSEKADLLPGKEFINLDDSKKLEYLKNRIDKNNITKDQFSMLQNYKKRLNTENEQLLNYFDELIQSCNDKFKHPYDFYDECFDNFYNVVCPNLIQLIDE